MAILQPFGGDTERTGDANQMLGAAAGLQLLDGLIGDASDLFGQLGLGQAQRLAAFAHPLAQAFHGWFHGHGIQANIMFAQDIL